jgi:DNA-binding response OmpR family regulator
MLQPARVPRPVRSQHILLVEDDCDSAEAFLMVLRRAGYEATWVDRADAALPMLRDPAQRPDVMLLDLTLNDIGGAALIEAFLAATPLPPTVVISASPEKTLRSAAERLRASGALRKPFGTDALLAAVEEAASASQAR